MSEHTDGGAYFSGDVTFAADVNVHGSINNPNVADQQIAVGDGTGITGSTTFTYSNQKLLITAKDGNADNTVEIRDKDGVIRAAMLGTDIHGGGDFAVYGGDGTFGAEMFASFNDAQFFVFAGAGAVNVDGNGQIASFLNADGLNALAIKRFTDTTPTGNFIVLNDATNSPLFAVDITGVMKLTPMADPPVSPAEGMIYADTDHHLYYYNGTTWKQLDN